MMNIKAHGNEENNGIDRISSLPDDVRTHILSFLSTKETVQTCILSKRWINTWASVPDLKFDIAEFGVQVLESLGTKIRAHKMDVEFVTKIELLLRSVLEKRETSCVNRFYLWLYSFFFLPWTRTLADFIGDVMKLGPRECLLEMGLCDNLNVNMDAIFTCASLIHLQLCFSTAVNVFVAIEPNSINLPCLETLNLDGVTMSDDSLKKLLLGCPLLEELVLEHCDISIIEICSNTLKKLVIYSYSYIKRLQISMPNLLYFDMRGYMGYTLLLLNMPLLVHASIYIPDSYDEDRYVTSGPKLFHSLSNVESLRLRFDYPMGKVLQKDFSKCLVFNNLKILKLVNLGLYDFDHAPYFLHHSPKLQELTLTNKHVQKKDFSSYPVFNNLKRLKLLIWCFFVFDLPPYFLHHSPKLQELTFINIHGRVPEFLDEETTQEGPGDAFVHREFLKTVRIVGFKNDNGFVDHLINKLLAHVKIIGDIVIDPYDSCCW